MARKPAPFDGQASATSVQRATKTRITSFDHRRALHRQGAEQDAHGEGIAAICRRNFRSDAKGSRTTSRSKVAS